MKKLLGKILVCVALLTTIGANGQISTAVTTMSNCQTQVVILTAAAGNGIPHAATYDVTTNQIIIFNFLLNSNVTATLLNGPAITPPPTGVPFTGLTRISVNNGGVPPSYYAIFTILTPSTNSASSTPVNSVVIPSDATGNVQILLESSSDLVNWIPSQAGTYGNTYSNRFFRVRALAQ